MYNCSVQMKILEIQKIAIDWLTFELVSRQD